MKWLYKGCKLGLLKQFYKFNEIEIESRIGLCSNGEIRNLQPDIGDSYIFILVIKYNLIY